MTARARRRRSATEIGNVIPLRAPVETTADIVRGVREKNRGQEEHISAMLRSLVENAQARHRERAQDLLPIGYAMTRCTLDEWIEIGERMLGMPGGRL